MSPSDRPADPDALPASAGNADASEALPLSHRRPMGDVEQRVVGGENSGDFLVVDVRGREAFAKGHVRGALSIPLDEIEALSERLPPGREVVTYGASQRGTRSVRAADSLTARGIEARAMSAGFEEWTAASFPTHVGSPPAGEVRCSCTLPASGGPPRVPFPL